jgi:hypothetical protein
MDITDIPLSKLTFAQKLESMETIWDDITTDESKLQSPIWYNDVLSDREEAVDSDNAKYSDWKEARERIKRKVS